MIALPIPTQFTDSLYQAAKTWLREDVASEAEDLKACIEGIVSWFEIESGQYLAPRIITVNGVSLDVGYQTLPPYYKSIILEAVVSKWTNRGEEDYQIPKSVWRGLGHLKDMSF